MLHLNVKRVIKERINKYQLLAARLLNALYYKTGIKAFRALSNKLAFGVVIEVKGILYMLTCVSDLAEVAPEYEHEVFRKLLDSIKPGFNFIDVGAHIGRYSFPIAKLLGENGLVIAIEPDSRVFKALTKGIELNDLRNVIALNIALGHRDGEAALCQKYVTATSSIIEYERCERIVKVSMRSLDSLITELKISHIDVIKIDAEGAEVQILKGAINTIVRSKPYIIVEVRHSNLNEIKELIKGLRYSCEILLHGLSDNVFSLPTTRCI